MSVSFILADDLQCGRRFHLLHGRCGLGRVGQFVEPETRSNPLGKIFFNMAQVTDHRFTYAQMFDLGKLEHQRRGDMRLLMRGLAQIELPRLAIAVGEALGTDAALLAGFSCRSAMKALGRFARRVVRQSLVAKRPVWNKPTKSFIPRIRKACLHP